MAGVAGLAPKVRVRILSIRFNVAGVAGLEPTTPGFGDQCSTN